MCLDGEREVLVVLETEIPKSTLSKYMVLVSYARIPSTFSNRSGLSNTTIASLSRTRESP